MTSKTPVFVQHLLPYPDGEAGVTPPIRAFVDVDNEAYFCMLDLRLSGWWEPVLASHSHTHCVQTIPWSYAASSEVVVKYNEHLYVISTEGLWFIELLAADEDPLSSTARLIRNFLDYMKDHPITSPFSPGHVPTVPPEDPDQVYEKMMIIHSLISNVMMDDHLALRLCTKITDYLLQVTEDPSLHVQKMQLSSQFILRNQNPSQSVAISRLLESVKTKLIQDLLA
jgi:hypothetical protein